MKTTGTLVLWGSVAAMAVGGCHSHPAPSRDGDPGQIRVELRATAGSMTYALANAAFLVERVQPPPAPGDITAIRLQANSPAAGDLTASLDVGRYTVTLLDGWQLERVDSETSLLRNMSSLRLSSRSAFFMLAAARSLPDADDMYWASADFTLAI